MSYPVNTLVVPGNHDIDFGGKARGRSEIAELLSSPVTEEMIAEELNKFNQCNYYIPEQCKYFNIPLYGEIITYKFKDPMLKCFLIEQYEDTNEKGDKVIKRKINKIEDVYISNKLPPFLLAIIRKINSSCIGTKLDTTTMMNYANYQYLKQLSECDSEGITNIFDSELFKKYNIQMKV